MTSKRYHSKLKTSELEKAFRDADKDRDGCLTQQEYFKVFRDQGVNLSGSDAAAIFRDKDKDRDGKISFEEFMGQLTITEKIWQSMDRDGDGLVSPADAAEVVRKYRKSLPENVVVGLEDALKKKSKARIDYEEFCQVMNGLRLSRRSGDPSRRRKEEEEEESRRQHQHHSRRYSKDGGRRDREKKKAPSSSGAAPLSRQNSLAMMPEPAAGTGTKGKSRKGDQRTQYSRHF